MFVCVFWSCWPSRWWRSSLCEIVKDLPRQPLARCTQGHIRGCMLNIFYTHVCGIRCWACIKAGSFFLPSAAFVSDLSLSFRSILGCCLASQPCVGHSEALSIIFYLIFSVLGSGFHVWCLSSLLLWIFCLAEGERNFNKRTKKKNRQKKEQDDKNNSAILKLQN